MSYYEEDPVLSQEEVLEIQEEYRKKRLLESLVGPAISTVFHVLLVVLLGLLLIDKYPVKNAEIEVTIEELPIIDIPKPPEQPDIEKPLETKLDPELAVNVPKPDAPDSNSIIDALDANEPQTDNNRPEETVSEVELSISAISNPTLTGGRTAEGIRGSLTKFGPKTKTHPSFLKGLWWLAKVQNVDGSWGSDAKPAYTGLALLTFLAHGETPTSKQYGRTVKKAMQWLTRDKINTSAHHGYPHAIKTYALAEAYAMTGISMLGEKMNECVEVIVKGQQKGGAFDYNYKASESRQDLSFSGWNYQALKAAYIAGCEVKGLTEAIYKSLDYLKVMSESEKSFAYTTSDSDPDSGKGSGKWTMVAVGTLCTQLLEPGQHKILKDELDKILADGKVRFNWNKAPGRSLYGWYYETNAMFHAQGKYWRGWKEVYSKVLVDNQHPEGYWVYPGKNHIPGDDLSQRVYATTLAALTLSVPFRYLPSTRVVTAPERVKEAKMKEKKVAEEENIDLVE